ncbi:efflux RND transporter periplasmic adaptor subunit, partial [Pseudoxanthomonas sp. SGD-10]
LQSTELSSLQAELRSLLSQIEVAKIDLNAKEQMSKDGIASNRDLMEAKNNLSVLEAEKQKVQSNLNLFSASTTKNVFQIKAPTSGIITAKNINSGSTVTNEGEPLFSISNLNNVWAMANIYSTDIGHISSGMEVEIKTISYPDEIFRGRIDVISQVLDENAKVLKARIVLDNEGFKLKPGMIADITALKKSDKQMIAVPTSCLVFFNGKNHVLVYKNDCNIEAREVTLLSKGDGITYIENGLEENEKIITKNQLLIFEAINN